jgi:hypothetical protein
MREAYTVRVLENKVLRKIFGPEEEEIITSQNCIMRSFTICMSYQTLLEWANPGG